MSSDARGSSGGVQSLRAMFEQQRQQSDSPDRGRTPSGSSSGNGNANGENGRKLSKIRSSFVTVEPSAQLARNTSSVRSNSNEASGMGPSPEASMTSRERRESFSMDGKDDAAAIEEMHRTVSGEEERRRQNDDIKEVVPEVAVETGPAPTPAAGTPRINPMADKRLQTLKKDVTSSPLSKGSVNSGPSTVLPDSVASTTEVPGNASSPLTSDAASPPSEVLQNLANQLLTPSKPPQSKRNGKAPVAQGTPARQEKRTPPQAAAGAEKEMATPPSTASRNGKALAEIITSAGDLQTSPGGVSPTIARHPLHLPESPAEEPPAEQSTSTPGPASKAAATPIKRKHPPPSSSRPKPSTPANHKSPRASRSTPNFRTSAGGTGAPINGHRPTSDRKPTVPVAPRFSSTARDRSRDQSRFTHQGTAEKGKRLSAAITTSDATERGIGFVKPRPKSPTRPLNLPSHLLAPTASSAAKLHGGKDGAPATSSDNVSTGTSRSRRQSTLSERGTKPTTAGLLGRKPTVKPKERTKRSAVGPPPKKKEDEAMKKKEPVRAPDEGFLARMMRPTASSASKVHGKAEEKLHKIGGAHAHGGAHGTASVSGKGKAKEKRKSEEASHEEAQEQAVENGHAADDAPSASTSAS